MCCKVVTGTVGVGKAKLSRELVEVIESKFEQVLMQATGTSSYDIQR